MFNELVNLFTDVDFLPHRFCITSSPLLLNLSVISHLLIFIAYFSISVTLIFFIYKHQNQHFKLALWLSVVFMLTCGAAHLSQAVTYWYPWHWPQTGLDSLTALISVYTAIYLWRVSSKLVCFPNFEQLQAEIKQRKAIEEKLRESESSLRTIIENEPECIKILDAQGCLKQMNPAGLVMIEADSIEQVMGKSVFDLITPEYRSAFSAMHHRVIAGETQQLEYEIIGLKGGRHWMNTHATPIVENNQILHLAVTRDITQNKRAEEDLRKSEAMLKEAQEIAHLGHWILEVPNNKLYWSDEIYRIFGVLPQQFLATYEAFLAYVHPEDRKFVDISYRNHLTTQADYAIEHRLLLKDGTIKYVSEKCKTEFDQDKQPLRSLGVVLDITERKLAEQLLQEKTVALLRSNADLERFAYSVSHDMRQPLRSITGHLQLMQRSLKDKLDPENQENLHFALEGAKRMDAMILSLLDYSRVGRSTETKALINTKEALDNALNFLALPIQEAQIEIKISGEWGQVFASQDELTRLFMNLISNAIKYREENQPPVIEISSTVRDKVWQVSIQDYGIGIDPKQIDRLFQFFGRLQSQTRFEGTGMGLALCRKIIEHHQGRIWVESAGEGQGSCFKFELPRGDL